MKFEKKGILSPFSIITSIFTGCFFPLLGAYISIDLNILETLYLEGMVLAIVGGFITHWILAHSIHDLLHLKIEKRSTLSKLALKILFIISTVILLTIAIYLTYKRGWPVMFFSIIGFIVSMYADGLIHHESQMAFGAMFLVIGSFYVQVGTLNLELIIWIKVVFISLFAFFSQYGWLLIYRLDDYKWNEKKKNISLLITKSGLIFLILYFVI